FKRPATDQRNLERLEIVPLDKIGRSDEEALAGRPHIALRGNQPAAFLTDNRNVGREAYALYSRQAFYFSLQFCVELIHTLLGRVVVSWQRQSRCQEVLRLKAGIGFQHLCKTAQQ